MKNLKGLETNMDGSMSELKYITDEQRLDWLATHQSEALDIFGRLREADYVRDYIDDRMIGDEDE